MVEKPGTTDREVIQNCASRIIESGALGRSQIYAKLLRYLVERALRGEVPKEFDISCDVFGRAKTAVDSPDAQTRVHVYKLRARLDSYYAGAGRDDRYRLDIPRGTYHVVAVANEHEVSPSVAVPARRPLGVYAALGVLAAALIVSLALNVTRLDSVSARDQRVVLGTAAWSGLLSTPRPILIAVGDHFFFGERGSHTRIRDTRINSHEELRTSPDYGLRSGLVYETLSYLPKSTAFALQMILPEATASGKKVSLKLVSELTPEDLRDHDVIYIGFVRAMAILRDYYFTRSNFSAEAPLYMSLMHAPSAAVYTRSGPVPEHNTDYGLFARFTGPSGNQVLVFAGIGDVGVSAVVRALATRAGLEQTQPVLDGADFDPATGFEVLVEAGGHSRTDLDFRVIGAYALRHPSPSPAPPVSDAPPSNGEAATALNAAGR